MGNTTLLLLDGSEPTANCNVDIRGQVKGARKLNPKLFCLHGGNVSMMGMPQSAFAPGTAAYQTGAAIKPRYRGRAASSMSRRRTSSNRGERQPVDRTHALPVAAESASEPSGSSARTPATGTAQPPTRGSRRSQRLRARSCRGIDLGDSPRATKRPRASPVAAATGAGSRTATRRRRTGTPPMADEAKTGTGVAVEEPIELSTSPSDDSAALTVVDLTDALADGAADIVGTPTVGVSTPTDGLSTRTGSDAGGGNDGDEGASTATGSGRPRLTPLNLPLLKRQSSETLMCSAWGMPSEDGDTCGSPGARRAVTEVMTWGRGEEGQLMLREPQNCSLPTAVAKFKNHRVIDIASSMYHSLAVTDMGTLYASGANDEGQILSDAVRACRGWGCGVLPRPVFTSTVCVSVPQETVSILAPVRIENLTTQRVMQVAGGMAHSACLLASQTVVTFGQNEFGQLGHSPDKPLRAAPKVMRGLGATKVGDAQPVVHAGAARMVTAGTRCVADCASGVRRAAHVAAVVVRGGAVVRVRCTGCIGTWT